MTTDLSPKTIYRQDYQPPVFIIDQVDLTFDLAEENTVVTAKMMIRRNPNSNQPSATLVLDGRELDLRSVSLDGRHLPAVDYQVDEESLTITKVPDAFELQLVTHINPRANTALEGLYLSSGNFCTQCEAEGFRKITYYLDRPDVLSRFRTTIRADRHRYPILLSNGNLVDHGELADDRHFTTWEDPFNKPCYLFALVAGNLVEIRDDFTTMSGRNISLHIYVEARNCQKCAHAMRSLEKAMRWDEETYGLEYDLDRYMIVAVDDFNMGAMENKGLNVFNSKYVLAEPETATDADFQAIEGVIAHEYFHNWTGDRVTCRDWFQLSLKEGLTVFRDQEFSASVIGRAVKRIEEVRILRNAQFPEDRGPLAHPVRPDSYVEINNFYTVTVYNKGAEVIRMIQTLIGPELFRRGLRLYLQRHDGQAATIEDFVAAMAEVSGRDFSIFRRWYSQAGTPELKVRTVYDSRNKTFTINLRQSCLPTPGQEKKEPFLLPVVVGLLDRQGQSLPLQLAGEAKPVAGDSLVLECVKAESSFQFINVASEPVLSCLREFSAPVILDIDCSDADLAFLLAHDPDEFNRWEAGQQLAVKIMLRLLTDIEHGRELVLDKIFSEAVIMAFTDERVDPALRSLTVTMPTETYLGEQLEQINPAAVHRVREFVLRQLALVGGEKWLEIYRQMADEGSYSLDPAAMARRQLKNVSLAYLMKGDDREKQELAVRQYREAGNMTDVLAALTCLANSDHPQRQPSLDDFYRRWHHDPLVLDKWFAIQAASSRPDTLGKVRELLRHPDFTLDNPNRVRSLVGVFSQGNPAAFHAADGGGYAFLSDQVLKLDSRNPQIAARLLTAMTCWRRYDESRRQLMRAQLERIANTTGISKNVYEISTKSLA
ncbi:MAG: aminopeptidase N [Pseudomonadota bacterium]|nr:aminopeptidase N [Pseudomonadota bacterium]